MQFGRDDLMQVMCPLADTAQVVAGVRVPTQACLVFVRRRPDGDRRALADLLPDDWAERSRLILAECVCDERGVPPPPERLAEVFARFDLETTERVLRMCCSVNELPYLECPPDERTDVPA
jgi:hypothetical protein